MIYYYAVFGRPKLSEIDIFLDKVNGNLKEMFGDDRLKLEMQAEISTLQFELPDSEIDEETDGKIKLFLDQAKKVYEEHGFTNITIKRTTKHL